MWLVSASTLRMSSDVWSLNCARNCGYSQSEDLRSRKPDPVWYQHLLLFIEVEHLFIPQGLVISDLRDQNERGFVSSPFLERLLICGAHAHVNLALGFLYLSHFPGRISGFFVLALTRLRWTEHVYSG